MPDNASRDDMIKSYLPKFRALIKPEDIVRSPTNKPRQSALELDAALARAYAAVGKRQGSDKLEQNAL